MLAFCTRTKSSRVHSALPGSGSPTRRGRRRPPIVSPDSDSIFASPVASRRVGWSSEADFSFGFDDGRATYPFPPSFPIHITALRSSGRGPLTWSRMPRLLTCLLTARHVRSAVQGMVAESISVITQPALSFAGVLVIVVISFFRRGRTERTSVDPRSVACPLVRSLPLLLSMSRAFLPFHFLMIEIRGLWSQH